MMNCQSASMSEVGREARWWNKLWKMKVPNKVKVFVWKSFHNSIPTMVNLRNHHVLVNGSCSVCKEEMETTDHALFQCSRAREIWEVLYPLMHVSSSSRLDIKDRWLRFADGQM